MQATRMSNASGMSGTVLGAGSVRRERIAMRRLLWAGPLAVVAATAATLTALAALLTVLPPVNPAFLALAPQSVVTMTVPLCACAIPVFALVARFAQRPVSTFRVVAAGALVLSWLPDVWLLSQPGSTVATVGALMVLHVVAAVVVVETMTRLAREA